MRHRARCAVFALCSGLTFGAKAQADTVEVTTTDTNGVAKVKVYALQDAGSGVLRLTIPLKDIRSDGSEIVCNDTDKPYDYRGRKVGPVAYELYK